MVALCAATASYRRSVPVCEERRLPSGQSTWSSKDAGQKTCSLQCLGSLLVRLFSATEVGIGGNKLVDLLGETVSSDVALCKVNSVVESQ